jgi:hypothetical protein
VLLKLNKSLLFIFKALDLYLAIDFFQGPLKDRKLAENSVLYEMVGKMEGK